MVIIIKIPLGNGNSPITEHITDMGVAHKFGASFFWHNKVHDAISYHNKHCIGKGK